MTDLSTPTSPESSKESTAWGVVAILVAVLVLIANPWTQTAYFEGLVGGIWEREAGYRWLVAAGFLAGFVMFFLAALITLLVTHRDEPKAWMGALGIVIFVILSALSWLPMAVQAIKVDEASTAIRKLKQAEDNNGAQVPARVALERATADMKSLKNHQDVVLSYSNAVVEPERLMGVLAAAQALPAHHPAVQFVIENNMARQDDVKAIQVALLNQVRQGDNAARNALAMLENTTVAATP